MTELDSLEDLTKYKPETNQERADFIRRIYNLTDRQKRVLGEGYCKSYADFILENRGFIIDKKQTDPISFSRGFPTVGGKNESKLENYTQFLQEGWRRELDLIDAWQNGLEQNGDYIKALENALEVLLKSLIDDDSSINSLKDLVDRLGKVTGDGAEIIGSGATYGQQFSLVKDGVPLPIAPDHYPAGPVSRFLIHLLNRGMICYRDDKLTLKKPTKRGHPLELPVADLLIDPFPPPEYWPEAFFELLRWLKKSVTTSAIHDNTDALEVGPGVVVFGHGENDWLFPVVIEHLKIIAENKIIDGPVVIHFNEMNHVIDLITQLIEQKIDVLIAVENNKYLTDKVNYHTGADYVQSMEDMLKLLEKKGFTNEQIAKHLTFALDPAHFHCAWPHVDEKVTLEEKQKQTIDSVERVLVFLTQLKKNSFPLEEMVVHLTQNSDRGFDFHASGLSEQDGTVPLKECYYQIQEFAKKNDVRLIIISEQSGALDTKQLDEIVNWQPE